MTGGHDNNHDDSRQFKELKSVFNFVVYGEKKPKNQKKKLHNSQFDMET